jgi:hypothetical protein
MILSGLFMVPLALVISVQLAREEPRVPVLATLQGIAGSITGLMIAVRPIFFAAAFSPDRNPELTKLINEMAFLFFVVPIDGLVTCVSLRHSWSNSPRRQ